MVSIYKGKTPEIELKYEEEFWNAAYEAIPKIDAAVEALSKLRLTYVFNETTEYKDLTYYSFTMLSSLQDRIEAVLKHIEHKRALRKIEMK